MDFQTPPWPSISPAAKDCVHQLLTVDAQRRPTAGQLLQVGRAPHRLCPCHRTSCQVPMDLGCPLRRLSSGNGAQPCGNR